MVNNVAGMVHKTHLILTTIYVVEWLISILLLRWGNQHREIKKLTQGQQQVSSKETIFILQRLILLQVFFVTLKARPSYHPSFLAARER